MKIEPFALPDEKPDFDYWIRLDCWTVDEALFLIHGLTPPKGEPDPDCFPKDHYFRTMAWTFLANRELADSMRLLSDYLDTAIKAGLFDPTRINPEKLIQWALKKDLPVHEELLIWWKEYNYVEPQEEINVTTTKAQPSPSCPDYIFRKEPSGWRIGWKGDSVISGGTKKGFQYIHYCIVNMDRNTTSYEIENNVDVKSLEAEYKEGLRVVSSASNQTKKDYTMTNKDMLQYKAMIKELEQEMNELGDDNNFANEKQILELRRQKEQIEDLLVSDTYKGKPKEIPYSQDTRLNARVGKAIETAIKEIEKRHDKAGQHFRNAFKHLRANIIKYDPLIPLPWDLS